MSKNPNPIIKEILSIWYVKTHYQHGDNIFLVSLENCIGLVGLTTSITKFIYYGH
mgnify:CR=1 FL=1|jgi:hypothetical protein